MILLVILILKQMTEQGNSPTSKSDHVRKDAEELKSASEKLEIDQKQYQEVMLQIKDSKLLDNWIIAGFGNNFEIELQDNSSPLKTRIRVSFSEILSNLEERGLAANSENVKKELEKAIYDEKPEELLKFPAPPEDVEIDEDLSEEDKQKLIEEAKEAEEELLNEHRKQLINTYSNFRKKGLDHETALTRIQRHLNDLVNTDPYYNLVLDIFLRDDTLQEWIEDRNQQIEEQRAELETPETETADDSDDDGDDDDVREEIEEVQNVFAGSQATKTQASTTQTTATTQTAAQSEEEKEEAKTELESLKLSHEKIKGLNMYETLSHLLMFNRVVLKTGIQWDFRLTEMVVHLLCRLKGVKPYAENAFPPIKVEELEKNYKISASEIFEKLKRQDGVYGVLHGSPTDALDVQQKRNDLLVQVNLLKGHFDEPENKEQEHLDNTENLGETA